MKTARKLSERERERERERLGRELREKWSEVERAGENCEKWTDVGYIYIYIYIYMCRERERERERERKLREKWSEVERENKETVWKMVGHR